MHPLAHDSALGTHRELDLMIVGMHGGLKVGSVCVCVCVCVCVHVCVDEYVCVLHETWQLKT